MHYIENTMSVLISVKSLIKTFISGKTERKTKIQCRDFLLMLYQNSAKPPRSSETEKATEAPIVQEEAKKMNVKCT